MRRNLLAAICIAICLEIFSRTADGLELANETLPQVLSVIAGILAGLSIVLLVQSICERKYITGIMMVAASAIIFSALLHFLGRLSIVESLPVLGRGMPYHNLARSMADIIGISAWILGFFGLIVELHQAKMEFGRQHVALTKEVKEHLHTQKSLRKSEALFRTVFERVGTGILLLDGEGYIMRCNSTFSGEIEAAEEELRDKNLTSLMDAESHDDFKKGFQTLQERPDGVHRGTYRLNNREGAALWFNIVLTSIAPPGVDGGMVIAIAENETARRRHGARILQQQKMEGIGLLAGGIAHDFNNLFVGIMSNAELLEHDLSNHTEGTAICRDIVSSTQRAATLCQQLLAYAGKVPMVDQALDLSQLIGASRSLLQLAVARNATLTLDCGENVPAIQGDPAQLRQALLNLLSNASEALEGAPGELRVATFPVTIREDELDSIQFALPLPAPGDYVCLAVSNPGPGISAPDYSKLFEPFYSTREMHSGLGLAAVQGIVNAHGAAIQLQTTPGRGTEFRILFPSTGNVADPLPDPDAPPGTVDLRSPSGGTILLVDDEEMVVGAARRILERNGFAVIVARNGKEGLELFRERHSSLSVVLLDLTMPVMNGETACRKMQDVDPAVPIVLCSGYSEAEVSDPDITAHVAGYLRKPYRVKALLEAVESVIKS